MVRTMKISFINKFGHTLGYAIAQQKQKEFFELCGKVQKVLSKAANERNKEEHSTVVNLLKEVHFFKNGVFVEKETMLEEIELLLELRQYDEG